MKNAIITTIVSLGLFSMVYAEPDQLTKVRKSYEDEQTRVTSKYVSWLKESLNKAMEAKNIEDVKAYQTELEKVTGTKVDPKVKLSVSEQLVGTTWKFWQNENINFSSKATAKDNHGNANFTWKVIDEDNRIIEGVRRSDNQKFRMTFNEDFQKGEVEYHTGNKQPTFKLIKFDDKK